MKNEETKAGFISAKYVLACLSCGMTDAAQIWPHRNEAGYMVGQVFLCNKCGALWRRNSLSITVVESKKHETAQAQINKQKRKIDSLLNEAVLSLAEIQKLKQDLAATRKALEEAQAGATTTQPKARERCVFKYNHISALGLVGWYTACGGYFAHIDEAQKDCPKCGLKLLLDEPIPEE